MGLDLFAQDNQADTERAARVSAPALPLTFGDTFGTSLRESFFFGQSISRENTRRDVIGSYADEVQQKLGIQDPEMFVNAMDGNVDALRKRTSELSADRPDVQLTELTDDELERRMLATSRGARAESAAQAGQEKTFGGKLGSFTGALVGAGTDPVNVVTLPLAAPRALGIMGTALSWAGIAGGTQTAIEAIASPYRDAVEPGYSTGPEPAANILGAAATGGVIGGGIKGLAAGWRRVKYGPEMKPVAEVKPPTEVKPLGDVPEYPGSAKDFDITPVQWPRTIRDAGNVVESEANIHQSNPFPASVESETAHRAAVSKAVDDLIEGRQVEVDDIVGGLQPREVGIESDYVGNIASGNRIPPKASELAADIAKAQEAESAYNRSIGVDPDLEAKINRLNREIDGGGARADAAMREKDAITKQFENAPEYTGPDTGTLKQLASEFDALERHGDESLATYADGLARVLKRHLGAASSGDEFSMAILRKALAEAVDNGLDPSALSKDAVGRYLKSLSGGDREFMESVLSGMSRRPSAQTEMPLQKAISAPERAANDEFTRNLTPKAVEEARADPLTDDAVANDLDKLRANKDLQVPVGETIGPDGKPVAVTRSIDEIMNEIDKRIEAANEIKACATPQQEAAE